ncbi:MAG: hypothetical protein JW997_05165 [Actinobacteria bacterium]|nr:hypothetical protein [Actinomycetota bacterium]
MDKFTVGITGSSLDIFVGNGEEVFKKNVSKLANLEKQLGFKLLVYDKLLNTREDAAAAGEFFEKNKIDMLIYFHATNAIGDIIYELAKFKFFIGLWAVEEVYKSGPFANASLVGLNQSSAIIRHFFGNDAPLFKWFYGDANGGLFLPKFRTILKVLKLVKSLKNCRVGLIGNISPGFKDMSFNEEDIYKKLDIDVIRDYSIEDLIGIAESVKDTEAEKISQKLIKNAVNVEVAEVSIIKSVKLYEALKKIAEENQMKAIALGCWPKIEDIYKIVPCTASSLLSSLGIPVSCEGDLLSAVSLLILKVFNEEPGVVMDLADVDIKNNSVQLWHCGNIPICLAENGKYNICNHYAWYNKLGDGAKVRNFGAVIDAKFKQSEVTVFRIIGDSDRFYYFTGTSLDNSKLETFDGGRGWIGDLKLFKNPINALDLINTIVVGGLPHHYPLTFKDVSDEIEELAYILDLKKVKKIVYKNYLDVNDREKEK